MTSKYLCPSHTKHTDLLVVRKTSKTSVESTLMSDSIFVFLLNLFSEDLLHVDRMDGPNRDLV